MKRQFNISREDLIIAIDSLETQLNKKPTINDLARYYNTTYYNINNFLRNFEPDLKEKLNINYQRVRNKFTLTKDELRNKLFEYKEEFGNFPSYKQCGKWLNIPPQTVRLHILEFDLDDYINNGKMAPKKFSYEYVYDSIMRYMDENDGQKPTYTQLAYFMGEKKDSLYAVLRKLDLFSYIDMSGRRVFKNVERKTNDWDKLPLRKGPITRQRVLDKLNEIRRINGLEELKE